MSQAAEILKEQLFKSLGLPWQDILPESRLPQILAEEGIHYRSRVYTPVVTLWPHELANGSRQNPTIVGYGSL